MFDWEKRNKFGGTIPNKRGAAPRDLFLLPKGIANEMHQENADCGVGTVAGCDRFGSAGRRSTIGPGRRPIHRPGPGHDTADRDDGRATSDADERALSEALSAAGASWRSHRSAGAGSSLQNARLRPTCRAHPGRRDQIVVGYSRWWGWFGRPIAVPLEVLGIEGRHLVSLDMPPGDYDAAPTWRDTDGTALPVDETVRVALSRS